MTLVTWAKMLRVWSTTRALRCVKLFSLIIISMFIIIIRRSGQHVYYYHSPRPFSAALLVCSVIPSLVEAWPASTLRERPRGDDFEYVK